MGLASPHSQGSSPSGADGRIPIIVLSGFLGSGKTTLLNALLRHPAFAATAVIVNELGEIGIDDLLVTSAEEDVVLLKSGCLCCSLMNTLRETLLELLARRRSGALPPFHRVVVETTGLADPAPILQSLLRDRMVTTDFAFDQLVVVADAVHGLRELDEHREARQQALLADRFVVSKVDLAGTEAAEALAARLRDLNPVAPVVMGRGTQTRADEVFGPPGAASGRRAVAQPATGHEGHVHTEDVTAHALVVEEPVGWAGVAAWIDGTQAFFGASILRCKGLLEIQSAPGPVLIQGVQGLFAPPEVLPSWPGEDHRSRLVCITRRLDPALLEASLVLLRTEPGTHRPASVEEMLALSAASGEA